MARKIQILDQHCVNQIAAGEVIERPLSVIKELVENSLDANAKNIDIIVKGNGTPFIKVRDDGIGIAAEDLPVAVLPHATSKIKKIEDLSNLQTLGFRGEALASIASVSKITLISRTADSISGSYLRVEGGKTIEFKETGCPIGTDVIVENLFYNTPARLKFLRSANREFGLIADTISRLALARPDVSFSLRHPDNLVIKTTGNGLLLNTIGELLGNNVAKKLIEISFSENSWKVYGYISPPELVRSSRHYQTFIVNGRIVKSSLLAQSLKNGYHTLIPHNCHPIAVINISLSPADFDVNVHPAKMEIKFKQEKELAQFISENIYKILISKISFRKYPLNSQKGKDTSTFSQIDRQSRINLINPGIFDSALPPKNTLAEMAEIYNTISPENHPEIRKEKIPDKVLLNREKGKNNYNDTFFLELRPLAQVFNTYILTTNEKSLYIVDQHAAHERINYEKLYTVYKKAEKLSQLLLLPVTLNLTVQEEQIVLENFETLNKMGFILESFGDKTYLLRGVPLTNNLESPEKMFLRFIDKVLSKSVSLSLEKLVERWIFLIACKESIKGHQRLNLQEMENLIIELGKTNNPYTCPHGRPTIIEITKEDLEKIFKRN